MKETYLITTFWLWLLWLLRQQVRWRLPRNSCLIKMFTFVWVLLLLVEKQKTSQRLLCQFTSNKCWSNWLCWGLTTRQPLRVILCRLPEKGRKEIEERVEEMKERDREERGTGMKVKKQKKLKYSPSTLTHYKDSRSCPTVSQYQLDAPVM